MSPAWYVTYMILALYIVNGVWLAWLGHWWGLMYWVCAAGITVAAMNGFTR